MNILSTLLAKTATGAIIEIIIIVLVACAIVFIITYNYYRSVYMKKIGVLEEEKKALERQVTTRDREISELTDKITEMEKK